MQSEAQEIDTYTSRNENTNALVGLKDAENNGHTSLFAQFLVR